MVLEKFWKDKRCYTWRDSTRKVVSVSLCMGSSASELIAHLFFIQKTIGSEQQTQRICYCPTREREGGGKLEGD